MNIEEYLNFCKEDNYLCGFLLVHLLVYEKQVLKMTDNVTKIDHYLQDRFKNVMNAELENLAKKFNYQIPGRV
jgi:hypothetical protein